MRGCPERGEGDGDAAAPGRSFPLAWPAPARSARGHARARESWRSGSRRRRPAGSAADCSVATATQLVEQYRLNHFDLPNPVRQLLCGSFMGPGSEAMAITIGAPTCWPIQHWAILGFRDGAWRLLETVPAYLIPPLTAVGNDIREETAVQRSGDARCFPSGGTRARLWHWDGTRFVAGPGRRSRKAWSSRESRGCSARRAGTSAAPCRTGAARPAPT